MNSLGANELEKIFQNDDTDLEFSFGSDLPEEQGDWSSWKNEHTSDFPLEDGNIISDDDSWMTYVVVDPRTLNLPSSPLSPLDMKPTTGDINQPEKMAHREFASDENAANCTTETHEYRSTGIPEEDDDASQNIIAVQPEPSPVASASGRRKSTIQTRNIPEEIISVAVPVTGYAGRPQRLKNSMTFMKITKSRERVERKKMHQLDPMRHPEAKGAIYSRERRQREKRQLAEAKANLAVAEKKIDERDKQIEALYGIISNLAGNSVIQDLRRILKDLEKSL